MLSSNASNIHVNRKCLPARGTAIVFTPRVLQRHLGIAALTFCFESHRVQVRPAASWGRVGPGADFAALRGRERPSRRRERDHDLINFQVEIDGIHASGLV